MKRLQHLLFFLVYGNLFIAACAVLMVHQTGSLLTGENSNPDFVNFVFFSAVCSYCFHYYFTTESVNPSGRIKWQAENRYLLIFLFLAGLTGSAVFIIRLLEYWQWIFPAVAATFLYSAPKIPHPLFRPLKKVAAGKTIFLASVWMYVTCVLPVVTSGRDWNSSCTVYAAGRFFYIYCIAVLFDYRDREDDKAAGIRSLITYMNSKQVTILFIVSFILFVFFTLLLLQHGFAVLPVTLLLVPGFILALLYNHARRNFSDLLYFVVLDGLLALPSLLLLIPGI